MKKFQTMVLQLSLLQVFNLERDLYRLTSWGAGIVCSIFSLRLMGWIIEESMLGNEMNFNILI